MRRCSECGTRHDTRARVCADTIAYRRLSDSAPPSLDCWHGTPLGAVVRPWCGTPVCARCRRADPVTWRPYRTVLSNQPKGPDHA